MVLTFVCMDIYPIQKAISDGIQHAGIDEIIIEYLVELRRWHLIILSRVVENTTYRYK